MHPAIFTTQTQREEAYLYIGKVAEITGASRKAIRHYESLGLIPAPRRRSKYRVYSDQDVVLVHMIKRAQSVGFSLAELKELVAEKVKRKRFPLKIANELFEKKRAALRREMDAIAETERRLVALKKEMNRTFG